MSKKEKQMKIVLDEIRSGKSRKEAAEIAEIPEYRIVNWYNEGKNGFGKENIKFYIKLKEIENNMVIDENVLIDNMNHVLKLFKQGKSRSDIVEQINISDSEITEWNTFGRASIRPYNYFFNEYQKIINSKKSSNKSNNITKLKKILEIMIISYMTILKYLLIINI